MDTNTKTDTLDALPDDVAAAAFRRLVRHLRHRHDAQNIDLMGLSGFCRNCLSRWMQEAAAARGHEMSKDEAREAYYGMPYDQWREKHQREASEEARAAFDAAQKHEASEG